MYSKYIQFCFFYFLGSATSHAQVIYSNTVREMGIGGSPIAYSSSEAVFSNPSFIPTNKNQLISSMVVNNYSITELNTYSLCYQNNIGSNQRISIEINNTGNNFFSQKQAGLSFGKIIGKKISAGIKLTLIETYLKDKFYKNNYAIIPDVALNTNPFKNIYIGVLIRNPVRSRMNINEFGRLPSEIISGISYKISGKLIIHAAVKQQSDELPSFLSGIEYLYHEHLTIRTGYHTNPISQSLGFSLKFPPLIFDLAISTHPFLGYTSGVGISFSL